MAFGLLVMFNIFPIVPTPQSICVQSIVAQVTTCTPDVSYLDSILFNNQYTIAPAGNPVYVYLPSGTISIGGSLKAYYFLSSGATVASTSASYCSTNPSSSCTPAQVLSGITQGTSSAGVKYLNVGTPSMNAGVKYVFQMSITDSKGAKSSLTGSIIPATPKATYTVTASTVNSTFTIGGSSYSPQSPTAFKAYAGEGVMFKLQVSSSLAPISSAYLTVTPGTSYTMNNLGGGTYRSFVDFANVGSYTVVGYINFQGGGTVTTFSVRVTVVSQTQATITTLTSLSTVGTFTITDSTTVTGADGKTTTRTTTNVCGGGGCTGTTTTIVGGSTTVSTTTSSDSTTTVTGDGGGIGFANQFIGGFVAFVGAIFFFRRGKR